MSGPNPDPVAEGRLAASTRGPTISNPYPKGTEAHDKWLEGYEDALDAEDDGMASDIA